tara:strand:+ start:260 stop:913 length:654 start_codon:yes stop_codon:yes gene_type:complete
MSELSKRFFSSVLLLIIIYLSLLHSIFLFIFLSLISFFSLDEFVKIFKKMFKNNKLLVSLMISILLVYMFFFSFLIWSYLIPYNEEKTISLIFILLICSLTDIGGYLVGKTIGGKKFYKISPNKTYSGVVGSFILPLIICYFFKIYFNNQFTFSLNVITVVILVSFISQVGDLLISFLKRKAKIKDTGSILPGHGGVLDRIDGILLGLPLGIYLISI